MNKYSKSREERKPKDEFIFGVRSVIEAVRANRSIGKILIQKGMQKELFLELKEALKGEEHQLQFVPIHKLDGITDANHQGVIAYVSPVDYYNIEEVVEKIDAISSTHGNDGSLQEFVW